MREKIRLEQMILVEGKYDAVKLADLVDAFILPVNGFSVFTSDETKALIRRLGAQKGIIILTDSDAAGFRIRAYLNKLAQGLSVQNAYVPAIAGKERRKSKSSKEGLLGVEGVPGGGGISGPSGARPVQRGQRRADGPAGAVGGEAGGADYRKGTV